ncbi:MBOAT family O-acyltransferase [Lachnobacterium bovis]|uniref:MBOAT family O-acyltransferase n=1 Tax=Lachnobacterium bovis TaxID=140626 RepID=UPI0003B42346|nr:MBOAT family O-acyltransferase [Lachnobacterium bovis]
MRFFDFTFILYFLPITLLIYLCLSFSKKLQNTWLFIASLMFYTTGKLMNVVVFGVSLAINYFLGLLIDGGKQKDKNTKKILIVGIICNALVLFVVKYLYLFLEKNDIMQYAKGREFDCFNAVSISFFVLRGISYLVDIYRDDATVLSNPIDCGLYMFFFPQVLAGPIMKYKDTEQFIRERKINVSNITEGIWRFAIGFIKKVVIANGYASIVDNTYKLTQTGSGLYSVSGMMAWIGAVFFVLQIYFDFSAYSDMAIGLSKIFGFECHENFDYPLAAKSINEFWRKCHMTMVQWFKDYVFLPLCGSKPKNADVIIRNIVIVCLLIGVWHNVSLTLIVWAMLNAFLIIVEKVIDFEKWKLSSIIKRLYVCIVILLSSVILRADSLFTAKEYFENMFLANKNPFMSNIPLMVLREYYMLVIPSIIFAIPTIPYIKNKISSSENVFAISLYKIISFSAVCAGMVLAICILVRGNVDTFVILKLGL